MGVAWVITALAVIGAVAGASGGGRAPGAHLTAAGAGLLCGVCAFGIAPEVASETGWASAALLILAVFAILGVTDRVLLHTHEGTRKTIVVPLLVATSVHSFLDGWSVRAVSAKTLTGIAVPLGLALHKLPEGTALGWIGRRALGNRTKAVAAASAVELLTPLGAYIEPVVERRGLALWGASAEAWVLAVVGGSFLFLAAHALVPERKHVSVVASFFIAFAVISCALLISPRV